MPDDVRGNSIVYPAKADMARGEFETDLGPAVKAYESISSSATSGPHDPAG